jgi:hypothetical protein
MRGGGDWRGFEGSRTGLAIGTPKTFFGGWTQGSSTIVDGVSTEHHGARLASSSFGPAVRTSSREQLRYGLSQ